MLFYQKVAKIYHEKIEKKNTLMKIRLYVKMIVFFIIIIILLKKVNCSCKIKEISFLFIITTKLLKILLI